MNTHQNPRRLMLEPCNSYNEKPSPFKSRAPRCSLPHYISWHVPGCPLESLGRGMPHLPYSQEAGPHMTVQREVQALLPGGGGLHLYFSSYILKTPKPQVLIKEAKPCSQRPHSPPPPPLKTKNLLISKQNNWSFPKPYSPLPPLVLIPSPVSRHVPGPSPEPFGR